MEQIKATGKEGVSIKKQNFLIQMEKTFALEKIFQLSFISWISSTLQTRSKGQVKMSL